MRIVLTIVLIGGALGASAPPQGRNPSIPPGALVGQVTVIGADGTSQSLPWANVVAESLSGGSVSFSGADGHYRLPVPPGRYDLTGFAYGFTPAVQGSIDVASSIDVRHDLVLRSTTSVVTLPASGRTDATIEADVVAADSTPVDAQVVLFGPRTSPRMTMALVGRRSVPAETWWGMAVRGRFHWPVPSGTYTLWVLSDLTRMTDPDRSGVRDDPVMSIQDVVVQPGETKKLNITVSPSGLCADCARQQPPSVPDVRVRIDTNVGPIDILVQPGAAPITSANFLKYVDGGFYTNGRFHRATRESNYTVSLPNRPLLECIQAGINPDRKAEGFPPIPLEPTNITGLTHVVGTVAMARGAHSDTATSDFFILLNDQPSLDLGGRRFDDWQGSAAFGHVVAGMDVVRKIQQLPTTGQSLAPPVTILGAKRVQP
jgi:peptidyl-prolyl cis-trans isomerase A (cyclophilin A)